MIAFDPILFDFLEGNTATLTLLGGACGSLAKLVAIFSKNNQTGKVLDWVAGLFESMTSLRKGGKNERTENGSSMGTG